MYNEIVRLWNAQADEFNSWEALSMEEQTEFAVRSTEYKCAYKREIHKESSHINYLLEELTDICWRSAANNLTVVPIADIMTSIKKYKSGKMEQRET